MCKNSMWQKPEQQEMMDGGHHMEIPAPSTHLIYQDDYVVVRHENRDNIQISIRVHVTNICGICNPMLNPVPNFHLYFYMACYT